MNQTKFQRLLHYLMLKQRGSRSGNPVCCDSPHQNQQESDHSPPSSASATDLKCLYTGNRSLVNTLKRPTNSSEQNYYLCDYQYEGETWCFEIPAESWKDAEARLKRMAYGKVVGEVKAVLPVQLGILAKLWVWFRNTQ